MLGDVAFTTGVVMSPENPLDDAATNLLEGFPNSVVTIGGGSSISLLALVAIGTVVIRDASAPTEVARADCWTINCGASSLPIGGVVTAGAGC